jgi:hypothetical protein
VLMVYVKRKNKVRIRHNAFPLIVPSVTTKVTFRSQWCIELQLLPVTVSHEFLQVLCLSLRLRYFFGILTGTLSIERVLVYKPSLH